VALPACSYDTEIISGPSHPIFGPYGIELYGMNEHGVAVGKWNFGSPKPCIWTQAGGFQAVPMPQHVIEATFGRINNNGWILANGLTDQGQRGFVVVPQGAGYLWIEIFPASPVNSGVVGINDKNQVVGVQSMGSPSDPSFPTGGFFWSMATGKIDILFEGWKSVRCTGINDAGVICGNVSQMEEASGGVQSSRGFVLVGDDLTIIEPIPPYTKSWTTVVNNHGIVGGTQQIHGPPGHARGFLFDPTMGSMEVLDPPAGYNQFAVIDLNDGGLVLGSTRVNTASTKREPALAWSGGGLVLLKDLVAPDIVSTLTQQPYSLTNGGVVLTPTSILWKTMVHWPTPPTADVDCDGEVGAEDVAILLSLWGLHTPTGDLNGDCVIDAHDLGLLLAAWSSP
jgi:hypothetical protein